jgi:hypothetical protein
MSRQCKRQWVCNKSVSIQVVIVTCDECRKSRFEARVRRTVEEEGRKKGWRFPRERRGKVLRDICDLCAFYLKLTDDLPLEQRSLFP